MNEHSSFVVRICSLVQHSFWHLGPTSKAKNLVQLHIYKCLFYLIHSFGVLGNQFKAAGPMKKCVERRHYVSKINPRDPEIVNIKTFDFELPCTWHEKAIMLSSGSGLYLIHYVVV